MNYEYDNMKTGDMQMYFDEEINRILDKINKGEHLKEYKKSSTGPMTKSIEKKSSFKSPNK